MEIKRYRTANTILNNKKFGRKLYCRVILQTMGLDKINTFINEIEKRTTL